VTNDIGDYLARRSVELGLGRGDTISSIQALLDESYPALTRVLSVQDGLVRVVTPNASLASDLRLKQLQILPQLQSFDATITKMVVQVRSLD
jgi:hypothetical protein